MLKQLRHKKVMKKLLWMVAVVIILVFGFLGQAYLISDNQAPSHAGSVFGKKISIDEYNWNFQQTQIQTMIQLGPRFNELSQTLNLQGQAWDRIILLHEAKKRRIKISDQEVVEAITNQYAFFHKDGRFDKELYERILRYVFRISTRDFEEGVRDSLRFTKLFEEETRNVFVPEEDVFNAYKYSNEQVQISYVLIANENFKDHVIFDEDKVKEFYASHEADFELPEMIDVEFIRFDIPDTPGEAAVNTASDLPSDNAAAADNAEGQAETEEKAAAEALAERLKDETKTQANKIVDALFINPNFEEVAQENNLTIERSGYFSREQPNLSLGWSYPVIQKLFGMKAGDISEAIETAAGYQIIKINEKRDSYIPSYEEAKERVVEAWTQEAAKEFARLNAEESLTLIQKQSDKFKMPDFAQIAKESGFDIHQTPVFSRGQYLPTIGISRDFQDTAFSLTEENALSGLVETAVGYCILHLDQILPIDEKDFENERDRFAQSLLAERKNAAFSDFVTQLRFKAKLEDNTSQLSALNNDDG